MKNKFVGAVNIGDLVVCIYDVALGYNKIHAKSLYQVCEIRCEGDIDSVDILGECGFKSYYLLIAVDMNTDPKRIIVPDHTFDYNFKLVPNGKLTKELYT